MTDLMTSLGQPYVVAYRYESEASHASYIGRRLQRGGPGEPFLGAPATPARRSMVVHIANSFMLEVAERALLALHGDVAKLRGLAGEITANQAALEGATP